MRSKNGVNLAVGNGDNDYGQAMTLTWRGAARIPEAAQSRSPFAAKRWGMFLAALYPLLVAAPLVILSFESESDHSFVAGFGVDCALVGFTILSLQFVLTARLSWLEAPFGLDVVLMFHKRMALIAVALLLAHPLLLASAGEWPLLTRLHVRWYIWVGRGALALLLLHVAFSLSRRALRLSYEPWRRLHNLFAVTVIAAGFVHSVVAGDDLHGNGRRLLWAVAPVVGLATWVYCRTVRPWLLARRPFSVISVQPEAPGVWTIKLAAPQGRQFRFLPGQFQFLRFLGTDVPAEEHPFTIASSPVRANHVSFTIKESGDFTRSLGRLRPGDRATVHGPFGRFSHDLHGDEGELVFIAAGVGITPLMSMLRAMRDRGESRRVTLVYATRTLDDVLFAEELCAMEAGWWPALKVIYVLSKPPAQWSGETGRIDVNRLERWCAGLDDKAFYLCCPQQMTTELIRGLGRMRVARHRIHCDYFSL